MKAARNNIDSGLTCVNVDGTGTTIKCCFYCYSFWKWNYEFVEFLVYKKQKADGQFATKTYMTNLHLVVSVPILFECW